MQKRSTGYTVVELIVTILLVSIVSVVAYPRLPSFSDYSLDGYCSELKSALRRVQTQAMSDVVVSSGYGVVISGHQATMLQPALSLDNSQDCIGTNCSILLRIEPEDISRGITMNSLPLEFDSFGRLADELTVEVEVFLSSPNGENEIITIGQEGYIDGCR